MRSGQPDTFLVVTLNNIKVKLERKASCYRHYPTECAISCLH